MTSPPRPARFGLVVCLLLLAAALAAPAAADHKDKHKKKHHRYDGSCISHCDCPPGELCHPEDGKGKCEPAHCPEIWQPVCGLDGQTYGNRCEADAAHVVVAHEGECKEKGEEGERCGGIQGLPCAEGEICDLPPGNCRSADMFGVCKPRPEVCTKDFRPVCGCDGKTYGNDCERLRAGVQKDHDGKCGSRCSENRECGEGNYCMFAPGRCEPPGQCETRPEICTREFRPVCGCDGKTYGNACEAAATGVSVRSQGECPG